EPRARCSTLHSFARFWVELFNSDLVESYPEVPSGAGTSHLLIIWLLQQAPIASVEACRDRHSRGRYASFSLTLLRRKPASNIWRLADGRMGSLVRVAGTGKLMSWRTRGAGNAATVATRSR